MGALSTESTDREEFPVAMGVGAVEKLLLD